MLETKTAKESEKEKYETKQGRCLFVSVEDNQLWTAFRRSKSMSEKVLTQSKRENDEKFLHIRHRIASLQCRLLSMVVYVAHNIVFFSSFVFIISNIPSIEFNILCKFISIDFSSCFYVYVLEYILDEFWTIWSFLLSYFNFKVKSIKTLVTHLKFSPI